MNEQLHQIAVLGASGGIGHRIVDRLLARGHAVRCQSRSGDALARWQDRIEPHVFDPVDGARMAGFVAGVDAVVFALGVRTVGATTLFSGATQVLVDAMLGHGVRRLVAITGVGAGDSRGHGGALYNRIIFPLVTRRMYDDKNRQEALIAGSGLDWTIVRPAPFSDKPATGPLQVHDRIPPHLQLSRIHREEVAEFIVSELEAPRHIRQRVFIGHP